MANVADFQSQAANPVNFQLGVPTQGMQGNIATNSVVALAPVTIGNGVFQLDLNPVLNASGSMAGTATSPVVGIAIRSQSNSDSAFYTQGYSLNVPAGQNVQCLTRGSVPVYVSAGNKATPALGDAVWILQTVDGAGLNIVTQAVGGTAIANATLTSFRVSYVPSGYGVGSLVVVTNTQNA